MFVVVSDLVGEGEEEEDEAEEEEEELFLVCSGAGGEVVTPVLKGNSHSPPPFPLPPPFGGD